MKMLLVAVAALATPAVAQGLDGGRPDWSRATPITIEMTDQGFAPREIELRRTAPYVLRVVNRSGKGHNLTQKVFFQLARVAPSDRGWTHDGRISLKPGESATVRFRAPDSRPGGTYEFGSTTLGDAVSDYKGVFLMR
ncbi:hypothetical protein [Sphingomonas bacterium]|uniref:hypothetical protein n=1 Tax=Sphingomonas bacterium TaxID=1895847 RepID=UPI00157753B1|nr:hypothetical protein [Sphingomonas bacterium]